MLKTIDDIYLICVSILYSVFFTEISVKMTTEQQTKETASQKYRRKLKENPELHAEHLQRERARDSKRREVMKMNMETDVDLKILARIRSKERMRRQLESDVRKNNLKKHLIHTRVLAH